MIFKNSEYLHRSRSHNGQLFTMLSSIDVSYDHFALLGLLICSVLEQNVRTMSWTFLRFLLLFAEEMFASKPQSISWNDNYRLWRNVMKVVILMWLITNNVTNIVTLLHLKVSNNYKLHHSNCNFSCQITSRAAGI